MFMALAYGPGESEPSQKENEGFCNCGGVAYGEESFRNVDPPTLPAVRANPPPTSYRYIGDFSLQARPPSRTDRSLDRSIARPQERTRRPVERVASSAREGSRYCRRCTAEWIPKYCGDV